MHTFKFQGTYILAISYNSLEYLKWYHMQEVETCSESMTLAGEKHSSYS